VAIDHIASGELSGEKYSDGGSGHHSSGGPNMRLWDWLRGRREDVIIDPDPVEKRLDEVEAQLEVLQAKVEIYEKRQERQ
jgi:hypothetical protein